MFLEIELKKEPFDKINRKAVINLNKVKTLKSELTDFDPKGYFIMEEDSIVNSNEKYTVLKSKIGLK